MPFASEAQRRFLWMKHPEIAKRWTAEYPNQKNLPMHKSEGRTKVTEAMMAHRRG